MMRLSHGFRSITTQHAHRRAATHPHAPHPPLPQSRICPRMLADVLSPPLRCRQMKRLLLLERPHPGGARSSSSKLVYSIDELATSCGAALGSASLLPPPASPALLQSPSPPHPRAQRHRVSCEGRTKHISAHREPVPLGAERAALDMSCACPTLSCALLCF